MVRVSEYLEITDGSDAKLVRCRKCGHVLGPFSEGLYRGAVVKETRPSTISSTYHLADRTIFRIYYCPSCATQLRVEPSVEEAKPPTDPPEIEFLEK